MKTKMIFVAIAFCSLLPVALPSIVAAETKPGTGDARFVDKVADANKTEIQLAKIALDNAKEQKVKDFANRMIADHGKASDELKPIAQEMNVPVPQKVSAEHQQTIDKLSKLKGAEFDKAYSNAMIDDHQKVVALFEKAEKDVQNADLKKFVEQTLPTLKEHLEVAEKL
jgi:putative membrane protein